ncbi:peptidase S1 [Ponticaulis sp.]|uniref:peptidase S1 n=1 Tax=Ponticaulis sp. TaxID=2020902 RepID=UPI000B71C7E5|nr:peptidase S1 [Ponticaulis sp.]MAI89980.1 peptidase S1 [Ponticaulis sp.]OUX99643.1 MAG: peptidase S1 [Hyphomonadaceae bacterium TMED5]|tara:strand:+ start:27982 stop:28443 length:462 start_codon:yes stop_codon:yes gene_type:complete
MYRKLAMAAAAVLISASGAAYAQNFNLEPTYGSASLNSGFSPDPYNVSITAGGSIDAGNIGCAGMVANAPDFRLYFGAGNALPLILSVASDADTTLVVNMPNGSWLCDDDSGNGLNPSIYLSSPPSGQYDIWVGSYGGGYNNSTLSISELSSN